MTWQHYSYHFGLTWKIKFAPNKTCSLLIFLKHNLQSSPHPPLFLNDSIIPETSIAWVLEFTFDSLLTWELHIVRMLNHRKQRVSQLYRCHSLLTSQDLCLMYRSWIRPTLEYGNILYCGAALSYDVLITCKLELSVPAVQLSNLYFTAVMRQSLDLSAVSLLGRDEGICKISA